MANALRAYLLAHLHKLGCTIGVNGFYNRLETLKIVQCFERILTVPVTNRISHFKSVKGQAILLSIDVLTIGVLRHHMVACDGIAETGRTSFALARLAPCKSFV